VFGFADVEGAEVDAGLGLGYLVLGVLLGKDTGFKMQICV
jgi:hypothetical protein